MSNIITAKLVEGEGYRTEPLWQWDYGQVLQFIEADLPDTYEVHFSNTKHGDAVKMIGDASGVSIPDMMLVTGQTVFVWLYLHTGNSDGETEYQITIPVKNRARPVEDKPTPIQQSLLEQALAALNIAVAQCDADVSHFPRVIEDYWCVWDEEEQQWVSTGTRAIGYSPVANVSKTGDTTTITVMDESGTTTAQVKDGKDGVDGFTPSAAVSKSGGTATITITDKNGTTSAQVSDGATGATPVIAIGTVSKLAPGSDPTATMDVTDPEHPVLSLGLVDGDPGEVTEEELEEATTELKSAVDEKAPLIRDTVTNVPIASVPDGADGLPLTTLRIGIEPIQDLHGQDAPYPPGGSKNKLPLMTEYNLSDNGVTCTVSRGVITLSGTASAQARFVLELDSTVDLSPSTNKIAFCNSFSNSNCTVYFARGNSNIHYWGMTPANRVVSGWTDTGNETVDRIIVVVDSGAKVSGTISPMLVSLSETDLTYTPYSNICPISGWTGCNVHGDGKNLLKFSDHSYIGVANVMWGGEANGPADGRLVLKAGTYTFSVSVQMVGIYITDKNANDIVPGKYHTTFSTFTLTEDTAVKINAYKSGVTQEDMESYSYQLELNSSATDYTPFVGSTYPISWQTEAGTVYGGWIDLVTGVLTVDRASTFVDASKLSNNGSTNDIYRTFYRVNGRAFTKNVISNFFSQNISELNYMDVRVNSNGIEFCVQNSLIGVAKDADNDNVKLPATKTWFTNNPVQLVYELATPLTYQLDPIEVKTLLGQNNVWADCGNVLVMTYPCDTKLYIDKKLAELTALVLES